MKVIYRTDDANISEMGRGCRHNFYLGWLDESVEENNRAVCAASQVVSNLGDLAGLHRSTAAALLSLYNVKHLK